MPRYKNETAAPIQWNGLSWGAGYEADSAIFCPPSVGLTKVSDAPAVQGLVLLAEDKTIVSGTPTTIELPYPASGRLWISCMAVSGACALKLGDGDAAIPIDLTSGWGGEVEWTRVAYLTLTTVSGGVARVLVEEVS